MLSEREISLRNVKCAAAREEIYFISLSAKQKISQWSKTIISYPALPDISLIAIN